MVACCIELDLETFRILISTTAVKLLPNFTGVIGLRTILGLNGRNDELVLFKMTARCSRAAEFANVGPTKQPLVRGVRLYAAGQRALSCYHAVTKQRLTAATSDRKTVASTFRQTTAAACETLVTAFCG